MGRTELEVVTVLREAYRRPVPLAVRVWLGICLGVGFWAFSAILGAVVAFVRAQGLENWSLMFLVAVGVVWCLGQE